jgi:hypothetical protein
VCVQVLGRQQHQVRQLLHPRGGKVGR